MDFNQITTQNIVKLWLKDREAWHAAVHGVTESETTEWLNWVTEDVYGAVREDLIFCLKD